MKYGPQDWDLLVGIWQPGADPRVWKHKACGKRLEFPDDKHICLCHEQTNTNQSKEEE